MGANLSNDEDHLKHQLWSELNKLEHEIDWSLVLQILRQNENAVRWRYKDLALTWTVLQLACFRMAPFAVCKEIHDLWPGVKHEIGFGWLPIHTVCRHRPHESLPVIELLTAGEDGSVTLKTKDDQGCLPLHLACFSGQPIEVVQLLIERGGQETVQDRNGEGQLPLHVAFLRGQSLDVVKLLVKHFPEATRIRDNSGRLPIDYARQSFGAWEIVRWLEKLARANSIFPHLRALDDAAVEELKQLYTRMKSGQEKRRIDQVYDAEIRPRAPACVCM